MNQTVVIYHDDLDGRAAGVIAGMASGGDVKYIPWEYDGTDPRTLLGDCVGQNVVMVDCCWPVDVMSELRDAASKLTWIDHHVTSINKMNGFVAQGLRSTLDAACVLAWKYFFRGVQVPYVVTLIGDRDIWAWKHKELTAHVYAGLMMHDTRPQSSLWQDLRLFTPEHLNGERRWPDASARGLWLDIIKSGEIIVEYKRRHCKEVKDAIAFEAQLAGVPDCPRMLCMNIAKMGSEAFGGGVTGQLPEGYSVVSTFYHNGRQFVISLYSDAKVCDVSKIAAAMGGGGHPGAAGFVTETFPYINIT